MIFGHSGVNSPTRLNYFPAFVQLSKMKYRDITALVPLVTLLTVMSGLFMINACQQDNDTDDIFEPITVIQPDTVITKLKQGVAQPLEIKFTTDRPIVYAQGMYSIDSTNLGYFDATGSDTVFVLFDSIPNTNKKTYTGEFKVDSLKPGYKVRVKLSMQALGNAGMVAPSHYFEKFLRFDVIK